MITFVFAKTLAGFVRRSLGEGEVEGGANASEHNTSGLRPPAPPSLRDTSPVGRIEIAGRFIFLLSFDGKGPSVALAKEGDRVRPEGPTQDAPTARTHSTIAAQ